MLHDWYPDGFAMNRLLPATLPFPAVALALNLVLAFAAAPAFAADDYYGAPNHSHGGGQQEMRGGFEGLALVGESQIGAFWNLTFNAYELAAGYNGMILFDSTIAGDNREYQLHRIYAGVNLLELYEGSMLRPVIGWGFGNHLDGSDFSEIDFGIDLHLPLIMDGYGFPRMNLDVNWSFRPFDDIIDHLQITGRISGYPFDGPVFRPLGFAVGALWFKSKGDDYLVVTAGLVYGAHF